MKRTVSIILLIVLFGFLAYKKLGPGLSGNRPSGAVPVYASSLGGAFGVQGEFDGTCEIRADSLELVLRPAKIVVATHPPYKGRRLIAKVSVGLARHTAGEKWDVINTVELASLEKTMLPGESLTLEPRVIHIPIGQSLDLSKHWIVFQIEETPLDLPPAQQRRGWSYTHSPKDIFGNR